MQTSVSEDEITYWARLLRSFGPAIPTGGPCDEKTGDVYKLKTWYFCKHKTS